MLHVNKVRLLRSMLLGIMRQADASVMLEDVPGDIVFKNLNLSLKVWCARVAVLVFACVCVCARGRRLCVFVKICICIF